MSGPIRPEPGDNWLGEYTRHLAHILETAGGGYEPAAPAQPDIAQPRRSVGPAMRGNLPLPEGKRTTKVDQAMNTLADFLPIFGEGRGVVAGHELAQQGHPLAGALTAAMSVLPAGGRLAKGVAKGVAERAETKAATQIFDHYSPRAGLTELDPAFMGTGLPGAERGRPKRLPMSHVYAQGATPEPQFRNLNKYNVHVTGDVYDLAKDPDGLLPALQKKIAAGRLSRAAGDELELMIQKKGYAGYRGADYPETVKLFGVHPMTPADAAAPTTVFRGKGAGNKDALPIRTLGDSVAAAPERVVAAAVRLGKDGEVFRGQMHFDALQQAGLKTGAPLFDPRFEEGFVTSSGRFVSRREATKIARAAEQKGAPKAGQALMAHDLPDVLPETVGDSVAKAYPLLRGITTRVENPEQLAGMRQTLSELQAKYKALHATLDRNAPYNDPSWQEANRLGNEISKRHQELQFAEHGFTSDELAKFHDVSDDELLQAQIERNVRPPQPVWNKELGAYDETPRLRAAAQSAQLAHLSMAREKAKPGYEEGERLLAAGERYSSRAQALRESMIGSQPSEEQMAAYTRLMTAARHLTDMGEAVKAGHVMSPEQKATTQKLLDYRFADEPQRVRNPGEILGDSTAARAAYAVPKRFAILTGENPGGVEASAEANAAHNARLDQYLTERGIKFDKVGGSYVDETTGKHLTEDSRLLHDLDPAEAEKIGRAFGQNAVVTHQGYHNLAEGKLHPATSPELKDVTGEMYTQLPDGRRVLADVDFGTEHPLLTTPEVIHRGKGAGNPDALPIRTLGDSTAARVVRVGAPRAVAAPAGATPGFPAQVNLPRHAGPRIPLSKIDDVLDETRKTYLSPAFEKLTAEGKFGDWYDTRDTEQKAIDALGDVQGPIDFRRLVQMMAATTARSAPPNNLRRASYYRALEKAGELGVPGLRTGEYKAVPKGFGHLANNAHHSALADLLEQGIINPITNPKPAGFDANLSRNFRPYTNDTRMATGAAMLNPRLVDIGALVKKVDKTGAVTYSPRDWAYAPMERAAQDAAHHYAGRGLLDVPAGADPTAFWQAKVWDALSGMLPGASPSQGTFSDIFNEMLGANARQWGVTPTEANSLIWSGRPFDLPLNAPLRPR